MDRGDQECTEMSNKMAEQVADVCEGCGGTGAIYDGLCPRCDACPPWIIDDDEQQDDWCCSHGEPYDEFCEDCEAEGVYDDDEPEEREPDSLSTLGLSEADFLPSDAYGPRR